MKEQTLATERALRARRECEAGQEQTPVTAKRAKVRRVRGVSQGRLTSAERAANSPIK